MAGPSLDDLARRNVPYVPGGPTVVTPAAESSLDRVMRIEEDEMARRRLQRTMELRDLEDEAHIAELNAKIEGAKAAKGNGGGPAGAAEGNQPLLAEVFGFFAQQNTNLQAALQAKDGEASAALRDELKAMREQMTAIASGTGGQGAMGQLQMLRDVIKFQSELQAEVKGLTPEPPVPPGVQRTQDIIAYQDAEVRRERMHREIEREREEWQEKVREFNVGMQQSAQRMGYVIHLANQYLPDFMAGLTAKVTGQPLALAPPAPPGAPPPPPAPAPPVAAAQAPAPQPPPAEPSASNGDLILTECPNCHRKFGVPPGVYATVCPYPDCDQNVRLAEPVAAGAVEEGFPG